MLEFVDGDMFEVHADIRVNTVNCVGVMGAGVALAFKQRYPEMFRDYQRDCKKGRVRPGEMHIWRSLSGDWVINFPTKRDWRDHSRYEDIDSGLDALRAYLDSLGPLTVALPALGCGHGGLDWERVAGMIRNKLDGVNAHVRIYAPANSRQAGHSASQGLTDDELKNVEQLGYDRLSAASGKVFNADSALFVKGKHDILARRWIALLPARSPRERELQALQSIASELAHHATEISIALIHSSRASEEIAGIFAKAGVETSLLLPFGVLTRRSLAQHMSSEYSNLVNLASIAPASARWSRVLLAQTMEFLRTHAMSLLVSDPEPDWLSGRSLSKWNSLPIAYLRYEAMSEQLRNALSAVGATAIGRRGESGTPNLDRLLNGVHTNLSTIDAVSNSQGQIETPEILPPPDPDLNNQPSSLMTEPPMVRINLSEYPDAVRRRVMSAVLDAVPVRLTVEAALSDDFLADTLRHHVMIAQEHRND